MGILDDAIREHLDLKRRTGADDLELKQLEDEAFGPPARPGDPDFPTSESPVDVDTGEEAAQPAAPEEQPAEAPSEEAPIFDEAAPAAPAPGPPTEAPVADAETAEPISEEQPVAEEPAAAEHQALEEQDEEEAPTQIFDQSIEGELDLDLELDDEELPALDDEVPVESMETVEHPMEEELAEPGAEPAPQSTEDEEALEDELDAEEEGRPAAEEEGDDDVLADTPEFLRDAPEDDELWFEQGEPKDFDFD